MDVLPRVIPSLNGIRAIAVLLVVLYHCGVPGVNGGTGVLIFFVLSGFLITWLLLVEADDTGSVSLRKFYARRALRIFPAFYCYWVVYLLLRLLRHHGVDWPQAVASLLYVSNYYQAVAGDPNTGLSHAWSLGVEEQFYALWPGIFLALQGNRRSLARALIFGTLVLWTLRLASTGVVPDGYAYEAFEMRADHLAVGCLLAVGLRGGIGPGVWQCCRRPAVALFCLLALAALSVAGPSRTVLFRNAIEFTLEPLLVAVLLVFAVAHAGDWCAFLNHPVLDYIGRISYGIYIWHQVGILAAGKLALPGPARIAGGLAASILLGAASHRFIERPFLRLKARYCSSFKSSPRERQPVHMR